MAIKEVGLPKVTRANYALAQKFIEMTPAPGDRGIRQDRLDGHKKALVDGRFRNDAVWASCCCHETGETYRVNGNHTSTMVAETLPLPELYVIISHYEADTLDDVAKLYAEFDKKDTARTSADINRAYSQTHEILKNLPTKIFNLVAQAIAFCDHGESYSTKTTADSRAARVKDHVDFAMWLHNMIGAGKSEETKCFARGAVIASMLESHRESAANATDFWAAVRDETGPNQALADRVLARWLRTAVISRGPGLSMGDKSGDNSKSTSPPEFYYRCITAWRAWNRGQTFANASGFTNATRSTASKGFSNKKRASA